MRERIRAIVADADADFDEEALWPPVGQVERWREQRGSGRYTLWTGDIGAALFAADCLEPRPATPIVEYA